MISARIVGFSLMFVFIFQIFSKTFIVADYYINKDFIATTLCINKDKPQLHCEGKCQLKKQLEKEDKKEKSPLGSFKNKSEIQLFSEKTDVVSFFAVTVSDKTKAPYSFSISEKHLLIVFHPPTV